MGLSNKSLVAAAVVIVALVGILMYAANAHAQFQPCVWPNHCIR